MYFRSKFICRVGLCLFGSRAVPCRFHLSVAARSIGTCLCQTVRHLVCEGCHRRCRTPKKNRQKTDTLWEGSSPSTAEPLCYTNGTLGTSKEGPLKTQTAYGGHPMGGDKNRHAMDGCKKQTRYGRRQKNRHAMGGHKIGPARFCIF